MGMSAAWAKSWDHKLKIKDIWEGVNATPPYAQTKQFAKEVADRLRSFQKHKLAESQPLYHDLDLIIEDLDDLVASDFDDDEEAQAAFNDALESLYNEADYAKRIWID